MSHRSYQPSKSCGSKLLQQKWDTAYYNEHRRMVKSAKPIVDTSTPPKPPHVIAKWKKQQLEKERAEEIERDNHTLMCKMTKIMKTSHSSRNAYSHHSLNDRQRQRELERVARENKAMLQRLQKVKPVYRISDWIDDWQRSEELTQRITAFPSLPTRRSRSAPHIARRSRHSPRDVDADIIVKESSNESLDGVGERESGQMEEREGVTVAEKPSSQQDTV